ncbi:metal ABC transporter substrate-binding protein [Salsipaludibacter albus]|uniref:metal ABC transporter substrate-binding protein n=1 Tax=Salsipaludibacter albus TaxID=2849650 RepID=UPI001EE4A12E|nr:metal ABC transporter substrate-binding protein [Salsipaludibacter albus]MBY5161160.1 metal ABC transporter substrate-binding protein [Salsipaludibacter albus]
MDQHPAPPSSSSIGRSSGSVQRPRPVRRGLWVVLASAVVVAGCATTLGAESGAGTGDPDGIRVTASTAVLGDLAGQVAGGDGEVTVLIEPGQDPHAFQLSARQVAELQDTDLLVVNGLGLEAAFADAIDQAEESGVPVLRVGESLDPLEAGSTRADDEHDDEHAGEEATEDEHADEEDVEDEHADEEAEVHAEDDGHGHGALDPHVWLDVSRMALVPGLVATALEEVEPGPWQERADTVAEELDELDEELEATIDGVPASCRVVAADHDSLAYLADRYDVDVPVTVIPGTSTDVDPSARDFATGVAAVREAGVHVVVVDERSTAGEAEAFADEAGIELVPLPLTAPPDDAGYAEMMRTVGEGLVEGWSGSCG